MLRIQRWLVLSAVLVLPLTLSGQTARHHHQKLTKSKAAPAVAPQPAPALLPGQLPAVPPDVTYNNGELLIVAKNSTLGDILNAIQSRTGATIEVSSGDTSERVAGRIGPGAARDVIADLLNGSHFNYVMLSRAGDPAALERVMLSPRGSATPGGGSPAYVSSQTSPTIVPTIVQGQGPAPIVPPVQEGEAAEDANADNAAENPEENQDGQNGEAQPETQPEEQPQPGNPQGVRTPEQMLQQLQQQQLLQQQQQTPQPGVPPQQQ